MEAKTAPSGVALVTTVWLHNCEKGSRHVKVLSAFLLYHISIGVDRVFVIFDGDASQQPTLSALDERLAALVAQRRIELLYRGNGGTAGDGVSSVDGEIQFRYADCYNYNQLRGAVTGDVASRQMLHAELVMRRCRQLNSTATFDNEKIRWLMHLDMDELLYCEGQVDASQDPSRTLRSLVGSLEEEQPRIDQLTVVNYEAVPRIKFGGNYFVSTTMFRRHTARIPISSLSQLAIRAWQNKSPYDQFFLYYDNGKSLVRVPDDGWDGHVVPASVHHWKQVGSEGSLRPWRSVSNFYDPRRSDVDVWREPHAALRSCILHYPVGGLEWLQEKYARLGEFTNLWGGNTGATPMTIPPCFHLQARDAAVAGQTEETEKLFKSQVMVDEFEQEFWNKQLSAGVCEEISFPQMLLLSMGFETERTDTIEAEPRHEVQGSTAVLPLGYRKTDETEAAGFTVEKAWMLAAISDQYL